jgi:phage gp36-like protein
MGRYIADTDLFARWGTKNVQSWADPDNDASHAARIATAITDAENELDARLYGNRYLIPLSPVSAIVKKLACGLAIGQIYAARGIRDEEKSKMAPVIKETHDLLMEVLMGSVNLGVGTIMNGHTVPVILP